MEIEQQVTFVNKYFDKAVDLGFEFAPKLVGGIIFLIVGLWVTGVITKAFGQSLERSRIDHSLIPFLKSLTNIVLKVLVVITVMGIIGIQMTSFVAIIGAAGLAIGMALSGTLQNFAGGVIILILKPFKIGDFIEAQGFSGTVKEITIFSTMLNTADRKLVIIPNGPLSTGALTNFSAEPTRRVDWTFGISYGDDVENFKKALNDFIAQDSRILKNPTPFIGLSALASTSVNFTVRVWVNSSDYWDVFFDMNEKVYTKFSDYDLHIPFPQPDTTIKKI